MKGKNSKVINLSVMQTMILCTAVLAMTLFRLSVATSGSLTEGEAFLSLCSTHPSGGYLEGPAGVPLLLAFFKIMGGTRIFFLRCIPALTILPLSWCVWWIGRRVAPHRPTLALWSVLALNVVPYVNVASLVMNGALVTAMFVTLAVVAGWHAVLNGGCRWSKEVTASWALFGVTLGVTTLFYQPVGLLLLGAIVFRFVNLGWKSIPWHGVLLAALLVILGWVPSLSWNARHDWIQWSSVAEGFDTIHLVGFSFSQGLLVALIALLIPFAVRLAYSGMIARVLLLFLAVIGSMASGLLLLVPSLIPSGLPSPIGVAGIKEASEQALACRKERTDTAGHTPFLIASTPGLAALLGNHLAVEYPERPGSPSVFVAESPSMNSSYALWPSYPDAVAAGVKDNLYTEEKSVSPFLGRNALYITTETKEELPQTITGAFNAVALLKEVPITIHAKQQVLRIYQCEGYRTLSL